MSASPPPKSIGSLPPKSDGSRRCPPVPGSAVIERHQWGTALASVQLQSPVKEEIVLCVLVKALRNARREPPSAKHSQKAAREHPEHKNII